MEECLYIRFISLTNFNEYFMYLGEGRVGGAVVHICIGTHSQPFLQNRSMDIYENW